MVYDQIDFHNVEDLMDVNIAGVEGKCIQRVPKILMPYLSENGQTMMKSPVANVELRFIAVSDSVEITLSKSGAGPLRMYVFWGDFQEREFYEITEEPQTFQLSIGERLGKLDEKYDRQLRYSSRLVRLMFAGYPDVSLNYHGVTCEDIRVPEPKEMLDTRLLCYGTSITHGAKLSGPHLTYPYLLAKKLGMDIINLGSAGTAFCEKEMADYIAARDDWDVATLALSVNMYNQMFTFEQFRDRIEYFVKKIARENPSKPVFCITLYTFFDDVEVYNDASTKNAEMYRKALRDVVTESGLTNLYLVEGCDMLEDFSLLAPDLIHPNDLGMLQMADNLSKTIKDRL